jgi:hypothetical protein
MTRKLSDLISLANGLSKPSSCISDASMQYDLDLSAQYVLAASQSKLVKESTWNQSIVLRWGQTCGFANGGMHLFATR